MVRYRIPVLVTGMCLAALAGAWAQRPDRAVNLREQVEPLVRKAFESGASPGLAIAVVRGGEVAWVGSFGDADREAGRSVTPDTRFYIASTTKALTALAAARLAARGALDLDARLTRTLPQIVLPPGIDPSTVLVRDLATHTHGIDSRGPVSIRVAYTGEYTNALLLQLVGSHAVAKTGRAFQYSNLGYDLLGIVLAPGGRDGWKAVVEREVTVPIGMASTTAWRSRVPADKLAQPYELGPDGFERIRLAKEDANMGPAGGHFSTAADLARLLMVEMNAGRIDGRTVIPADVIASTQKTQVPQDRQFAFLHRTGWALGWDVGTYDKETVLHRFGGFAGYYSHVSFMPERRIGVVVLANGGGAASSLAEVVAMGVYDRLLERADAAGRFDARAAQLRDRMAQGPAAAAKERATRAARQQPLPHPIADYAGVFENEQYGRLELRVAGGRLEAVMGVARSQVEVYEAATNRLRVELFGGGSVVQMEFPAGGGPAMVAVMLDARFERK